MDSMAYGINYAPDLSETHEISKKKKYLESKIVTTIFNVAYTMKCLNMYSATIIHAQNGNNSGFTVDTMLRNCLTIKYQ